jgi:hypothetical protein
MIHRALNFSKAEDFEHKGFREDRRKQRIDRYNAETSERRHEESVDGSWSNSHRNRV